MSASNIPWLQVATVCALFCVICTCVKDLERLRKVSAMCIHVHVSVKEHEEGWEMQAGREFGVHWGQDMVE